MKAAPVRGRPQRTSERPGPKTGPFVGSCISASLVGRPIGPAAALRATTAEVLTHRAPGAR
jgi:hypothetical protein